MDKTLAVVGLVTILAIVGVLLLKSRETEHLQTSEPTSAAAEAQVFATRKDLNNDILSQAK